MTFIISLFHAWIRKSARCLSVVLAVGALANPVRAAEPTSTELAVARRLFKQATELYNAEHWAEAAQKLRQAIAIKDTPGLRYHLAHCEQNMGLLVEAMLDYDRARELIEAGAPAADVAAMLPDAQRALARRVPSIVILSPQGVKNVRASIDGQTLAPSVLGRPAPVNPGSHRVRAWAEGYLDYDAEISVKEGERRVVTLRLTPEPRASSSPSAPAPAPRPRPAPAQSGLSPRTYVLVGEVAVTTAALAVGVTFAIAGSYADDRVTRANDRVDRVAAPTNMPAECSSATGDLLESCRDLTDAVDDRNRYRLLSTAGFVGAGLGALATIATYVFWSDQPEGLAISAGANASSFQFGIETRF
jgi:hypothetical protein